MKLYKVLAIATALPACMADADVDTRETQQDVSYGEFFTLTNTTNLPTTIDSTQVGTIGVTCVLTGVGGDLTSGLGAPQGDGVLNTTSEAGLRFDSSGWQLYAFPGETVGTPVSASAECIGTDTGRTAVGGINTAFGFNNRKLAVDDGKNVCFLTHVANTEGNSWGDSPDSAEIKSVGGYLTLVGTGWVEAQAICLAPNKASGTFTGKAGSTINLWANGTTGTQCGLTAITGSFRSNNTNDGVSIGFVSGQYNLRVSPGYGAKARCLQ